MMETRLASIGRFGALLTLVVVAASVLLRLGTSLDAGGNASSTLPAPIEAGVRLTHRIAASAVALLALAAAYFVARARPIPRARLGAAVSIVLLTAFLATIGRYTTGYSLPWVTVGNVAGGMALACAFWWLREASSNAEPTVDRHTRFARFTLAAVLVHAAMGALADAMAIRGTVSLDPLHIAFGPLVVAVVVVAALRNLDRGRGIAALVAALAVTQLALGMALAATGARSIIAGWPHAMIAGILGLGLVGLASPCAQARPCVRCHARGILRVSCNEVNSTCPRSATTTSAKTFAGS